MDHLPLPDNPTIETLDIPFLCKEPYDGGHFLAYPGRTGWNVVEGQWPESLSCHGQKVSDAAEIGAFLQTWLYFGLLHEVIGKTADPALFKVSGFGADTPCFSSKCFVDIVTQWSAGVESTATIFKTPSNRALGLESGEHRRHAVGTWLRARQEVFNSAKGTLTSIMMTDQVRSSTMLQLVLLGIAALADYLSLLVVGVAHDWGVDETSRNLWELEELELCLQPLFSKMRGWCPSRLRVLYNDPACTLGVLWYLANLTPPKVHDDHVSCVWEQCNSLHVNQHDYCIQHIHEGCKCTLIGPSMEKMVGTVQRGSIAVFDVQRSATGSRVILHDKNETSHYVAISHVWADGHGNLDSNALPTCVLEKLQKDVDALGLSESQASHTPIWMDTICLPRYPLDLRRKAVLSLSDVFTKATGVLVLDSYLTTVDCSSLSLVDVLARISISGWTSRLWTFSEGQLAQRIWFQFRDKAIDLQNLYRSGLSGPIPPDPNVFTSGALRLTTMTEDMTLFYSATPLRLKGSHQKQEDSIALGQIKVALSSRQTSWASDEALCLGAILQVDLSAIVDSEDTKKMAAFWQQVKDVPTDLIFMDYSPKLLDEGCRWAPTTMLTGASPELRLLQHQATNAQPTDNGLEFTINGALRLYVVRPYFKDARQPASSRCHFINFYRHMPWMTKPDKFLIKDRSGIWWAWYSAFLLKDRSGRWFACLPMRHWHPISITPDYEHDVPVFFMYSPDGINNISRHERIPDNTQTRAVFATYKPPSADHRNISRAHTVLKFVECSEDQWTRFDELVDCADAFTVQHQDEGELEIENDESLDALMGQIIQWLQSRYTEEALVELVTSVFPPDSDVADTDIMWRLRICARFVCYFHLVGSWYMIETSGSLDRTTWCVD